MKLYYSKGACSLAVRIILNELNIPFKQESVDLKTKVTETGADFLKINPKGAVPALELDNGDVLTENAIIQQYLADTHKATNLLPPIGDIKRYQALIWLNYVSTELHKGCGPLFNSQVPEKEKEDIFRPALKKKFQFIDQHLAKSKFLFNDHFTLADGYLFIVLRWLNFLKVDISDLKKLTHYFDELKKRPAIQKAMNEEGLTA